MKLMRMYFRTRVNLTFALWLGLVVNGCQCLQSIVSSHLIVGRFTVSVAVNTSFL